jgi:hypothetical protein
VGAGLTDSGVTLDFRGSSKTQRLTKETISMSDEQICGIEWLVIDSNWILLKIVGRGF